MKKYIIAAIVVVAVVVSFFLVRPAQSDALISTNAELATFSSKGLLYLSFLKDVTEPVTVSAFIPGEPQVELVKDYTVVPRKDWRNSVPVSGLSSFPNQGTYLRVVVSGKEYKVELSKVTSEAQDVLELEKTTKPEEAMKGWASPARAAEPVTEAARYGQPDIGQKIAECAPTSAANSLISLADEHGVEMPSDEDLINELKGDMDWTPANGVLPDDFVAGKNKWAARHGVPIRTTKVGGQNGQGTLESILDAMSKGKTAAEIRIKFADANGKVTGGHMVTVTGVRIKGDQTFIDVNDPRTPEGTDTYEMEGNVLKDYPYEGITVLSWGFIQHWEGTPTGTQLDPMLDAEMRGIQNAVGQKEKVKVIIVKGKKVPISQVHVGKGPECKDGDKEMPHYHASTSSVTALDGTKLPDPGGCGYGMVKDIPVEEVEVP